MFLERFHSVRDGRIHISAVQASQFAKEIAGDFNPIHDPDARRFCVPGDLLFALVLSRFGLSGNMTFKFRNLLGDGVPVTFRENGDGSIEVCDDAGKVYLDVTRNGACSRDPEVLEAVTRCYVAASGKNFPHTLKPLMERHGVMFNPERPMVMYESMSVNLDDLDARNPELTLHQATLEAVGKRGHVTLEYHLHADGRPVGTMAKQLVLGGLRPYSPEAMAGVIEEFYRLKARGIR
ncbi:DUF3581 family protein [Marinobacter lutaoensis]|jgi:hypothetical protein|uniref:DUF3581 family protein n=1 Tax=Marinobacter lutaoensis TaxID=135739 RepID=UPI000C09C5EA|nr:DUF3581 family protein [Marinobacter lutaoensis]MBE01796.1 hypothetical protein [Marinobacter sp.]MBI44355.1 hypothetical protein [Oceanospirillales bacterium]NVD37044.1 DUF3581 domain-containing protein [Marinobacter lutaoensis]|tara:strand:+ start:1888 stop:2595 length:708 start_codon:yes stop_codon:yes gene_type:complete